MTRTADDKVNTVAWLISIRGGPELEDLPRLMAGFPISVVKRGNGYYLRLPIEETGPTHERVIKLAEKWAPIISGAALGIDPNALPIAIKDYSFRGEDKDSNPTAMVVSGRFAQLKAGRALVSGVATVSGSCGDQDQPEENAGPMVPILEAARASEEKMQALTLIGLESPSWSQLYVAFELVESDAGNQMYERDWISKADANLFNHTANNHEALGIEARHGPKGRKPPCAPMTHPKAIRLIRKLVHCWVIHAV